MVREHWFKILILFLFFVAYALHWANVLQVKDRLDELGCNALCPDGMVLVCERPLNTSWEITNISGGFPDLLLNEQD